MRLQHRRPAISKSYALGPVSAMVPARGRMYCFYSLLAYFLFDSPSDTCDTSRDYILTVFFTPRSHAIV
jgi:hypothetical protein